MKDQKQSGKARRVDKLFKMGDKVDRDKIPVEKNSQNEEIKSLKKEFDFLIHKSLSDFPEDIKKDLKNQILEILISQVPKNEKFNEISKLVLMEKQDFELLLSLAPNMFLQVKKQQNDNIVIDFDFLMQENQNNVKNEDFKNFQFLKQLLENLNNSDDLFEDIMQILSIEDDIECQNRLMEISQLQLNELSTLFENRYSIYYSYFLKNNPQKITQVIEEVEMNQEAKNQLKRLLSQYQKDINITQLDHQLRDLEMNQKLTLQQLNKIPKKLINFQNQKIEFLKFSHQEIQMPEKSIKQTGPFYEQITVPSKTQSQDSVNLIGIDQFPEWCRSAFSRIKTLNVIQSLSFKSVFESQENLLLSAPTGSGKTIIALMAILGMYENNKDDLNRIDFKRNKVVYIAPMKALVNEVVKGFGQKLSGLGVKVREFTGDVNMTYQEFQEAQVVVSTPEKWDVVARKSSEKEYLRDVKLFIVDEVHLLNDDRGPVLESILTQIMKVEQARILALSATLPNYKEVALFLQVPSKNIFYFDSTFRPVPLDQQYVGIMQVDGVKKMNLINKITYQKVIERVKDNQILIFVHSRKETHRTGQFLKNMAFEKAQEDFFIEENSESHKILESLKGQFQNDQIRELITSGIGIHHAGMGRGDREKVENLFSQKHLSVLISTATLAWGVNLPAQTVLIKNTQVYSPSKNGWTELSIQDVLQMLGRAGRPGFDNQGEGIIITSHKMMRRYLYLVNEQLPIESQLTQNLSDIINALIVNDQAKNIKDLMDWLFSTYYFIRSSKNPKKYGIEVDQSQKNNQLIHYYINLIHTCLTYLSNAELIDYNLKEGKVKKKKLGKLTSYFYVSSGSMKTYMRQLPFCHDLMDIFHLFSQSQEFQFIKIRDDEILEIENLLSIVPVPIKSNADDPTTKINILLQCYISRLNLKDYVLKSEMIFISQNAQRIMRCLYKMACEKKLKISLLMLDVCLMVEKRAWRVMNPLRQFNLLPLVYIRKMEQIQNLSWENQLLMSKTQIQEIFKNEGASDLAEKLYSRFPQFILSLVVQPIYDDFIKLELNLEPNFQWDKELYGKAIDLTIFIHDQTSDKLILCQSLRVYKFQKEINEVMFIDIKEPLPQVILVKVKANNILGCKQCVPLTFFDYQKPPKTPQFSNFSKSQEISKISEKIKKILNLQSLNELQKEVIPSLINSNDNILISSINNVGKFNISLLGVVQNLKNQENDCKVVILYEDHLSNENQTMVKELSEYLNVKMEILNGDFQQDIKSLKNSQVILSKMKYFDKISRNYKRRKSLLKINTLIVKDVHLINFNTNYEMVLTKMKILKASTGQNLRFILLGKSLQNYQSLCQWMNIIEQNCFCFSLDVRLNNLSVKMKLFDQFSYQSLNNTMIHQLMNNLEKKDINQLVITSDVTLRNQIWSKLTTNQIYQEEDIFILNHTVLIETVRIQLGKFLQSNGRILVTSLEGLKFLNEFQFSQIHLVDNGKFKLYNFHSLLDLTNDKKRDAKVIIYGPQHRKSLYQKMMSRSVVVESKLNEKLIECLNQEFATGVVQNEQECLDWITWTYYYKRILENPNYYFLAKRDSESVNQHLSEQVDNCLEDLKKLGCLDQENDITNIGVISAFFSQELLTVYQLNTSSKQEISWSNLLYLLTAKKVHLEPQERQFLKKSYQEIKYQVEEVDYSELSLFILLQKYLSRELQFSDQQSEISNAFENLMEKIQIFVECAVINRNLKGVLKAMKISQMVVQQMWSDQNNIYQLPHVDKEMVDQFQESGVREMDDFYSLDEKTRDQILGKFDQNQISEIAKFSNFYPSMEIEAQIVQRQFKENDFISINVSITRENEDYSPQVLTNSFINKREEWWLVVCDKAKNEIFANKKLCIKDSEKKKIKFKISRKDHYKLTVMLISDSYLGCDIESNLGDMIIN